VIELVTENGEQHHVVVTRLQDKTATLNFSGELFECPLAEINNYWLGQFLILWHPPTLPVPVLKAGVSHEAVVWIKKHLDHIEGKRGEESSLFNKSLKQRIIAFQRQQGLVSDGVVGEQTLLMLQAWSGTGPLLSLPTS
jgi:general secretion pathway protein A